MGFIILARDRKNHQTRAQGAIQRRRNVLLKILTMSSADNLDFLLLLTFKVSVDHTYSVVNYMALCRLGLALGQGYPA